MQLSQEIFNILKGANIKLKLFDPMGNKTLDPEISARFYAYDNDFLVTIREEEDGVELVVQAGASFNFNEHKDLLNSIKKAGHNAMAEYNIRKFDKNIELKDFAHDVVKEDERTEKAMKDMQPSAVTGYYEITDFWKEHTQMWDKSVDEVMQMIYEWTWIEMTTATRDRDELAKRTLAIVVDALRNKKDDMTFDDMIAQLESKNEEIRRLKELSGIKEADRSDVTHAQLLPHIKNVKAAMIRHAQEDPSEANEFIEHLDDMMQVGDVEVVDMMQPDYMDTEARDSLIGYFKVSISQDPTLYNMLFPGEDIKWDQSEYKDMFESMNEGGNSVEAFMAHVVDHAKEIQADNYRMTDSSYYEFTDEIDTDDEEFMSMPQVQAILKAIPHVDMENTDIKHAIDVLASGELLEAETESYSPGDEYADSEGMVSNCCGAPMYDYDDGHGRCSDCHDMAAGETDEEFYENTYDTKDFEVNPRAGHRDQMAHPENQMGTGPGIKTKPKLRPKNLGKKQFPTGTPKLRPDNLGEGYTPATGSMKTSYIQLPENTKLIIKHTKGVNEEVRGSRSRNIKALFIENSAGERFRFPHKYLQGAKAMANHVSNGGTPYDAIGESIVNLCTEVAQCTQFLRHVRTNKLTNEGNENIVETVKQKLKEFKNTVKSLQTSKGYNNYQVPTTAIVEEKDKEAVDITDKFMYNTFETANMDAVLETVARIVKERDSMTDLTKTNMNRLYDMIKNKEDFKLNIDPNDPEHPDNEDPIKYSGGNGAMAKLVSHLSYLAMNSKNDEVFNLLSQVSGEMYSLPKEHVILLAKIAAYLDKNNKAPAKEPAMEDLAEATLRGLRRKIA